MPRKSNTQSASKSAVSSEENFSKDTESLKDISRSNRKKRITGNGVDRHEMIAMAAYYLAERRDFSDGNAMEDWLEAEAEIDSIE